MPSEAQTRLLRVLQDGEYVSVGGRAPVRADVRIIAATHRDLRALIRQGLFREDLYYRLNVVPIRMPPLRERTQDIPALLGHFGMVTGGRPAGCRAKIIEAGRTCSVCRPIAGRAMCANSKIWSGDYARSIPRS